MRLFKPLSERVTVFFRRPDGDEERQFELREGLLPDANQFQQQLNEFVSAAGTDVVRAGEILDGMLQGILAHPLDGFPVDVGDVAALTPSVQTALVEAQAVLFGFREEDEVGKKLAPVVLAVHRLRAMWGRGMMTTGSSLSLPSPDTSASAPTASSEPGLTESSTTTTVSISETSGDSSSGTSSSTCEEQSLSESPTSD